MRGGGCRIGGRGGGRCGCRGGRVVLDLYVGQIWGVDEGGREGMG